MEENVLCQVWKTVRMEAGPHPFQGYWSTGDSKLFDFRFLDAPQLASAASPAANWTRDADKIRHPGNESALYLLIQAATPEYLVLEMHMLYSGQDRHTLTLYLVPDTLSARRA
ncbi:hypothetical protein [Hymenobacter seoulensis]